MYRFCQVDVFTDRLFEGNQLAVFPDAGGLSAEQMQLIAREMNLSETAFVVATQRADCDVRVRIFTPSYEMVFAGHPTIGTAFVLARLGRVPAGADAIVFEEGVGPVHVVYEGPPLAPVRAWLTVPPVSFGPTLDERSACAALVSLAADDLVAEAPLEVAGAGPRFVYLPVRDRECVDRAEPDLGAMSEFLTAHELIGVFVFAVDSRRDGKLYSRMFAPTAGIIEDPATGSAAGPLAAYAVRHRLVDVTPNGGMALLNEQGTKMGRRSVLHVRMELASGVPQRIEVGGAAVHVFDGELALR